MSWGVVASQTPLLLLSPLRGGRELAGDAEHWLFFPVCVLGTSRSGVTAQPYLFEIYV